MFDCRLDGRRNWGRDPGMLRQRQQSGIFVDWPWPAAARLAEWSARLRDSVIVQVPPGPAERVPAVLRTVSLLTEVTDELAINGQTFGAGVH